ncbi:MAG: hypothetical protein E7015_02540 [Alphaproteobacteria bacterium]|nr:hypothetical protein [Alphaproteobacteria bacterium]
MTSSLPLCVDLDGTLIFDDVSRLAFRCLLKKGNVCKLLRIALSSLGNVARIKHEIAAIADLDPATLRYNEKFLSYVISEKQRGKKLILSTGANHKYARCIADYLGIFDKVFASSESINLIAEKKAKRLVDEFGRHGFIYAGNSMTDIPVWKQAAGCLVVSPLSGVLDTLKKEKLKFKLM